MGSISPSTQLNGAPPTDITRDNVPIYAERHMKIICIGAGASGFCFAYKLQRSFSNFDLTIYEKNEGIAGTWWENRYPGVACDVPAHNYTWSWEPKRDWSRVYAGADEIFQYFDDFKNKYDLGKYCQLRHQVVGAKWDSVEGIWEVEVQNLLTQEIFSDHCHILINAAGILNNWKWPDIPGLSKFRGHLLHSANWDPKVSLQNKVVGLIGNGSSGIQILPAIQPEVEKLVTFVRGPTWIAPPFGMQQKAFSVAEKTEFATKPEALLKVRKDYESNAHKMFPIFLADSDMQRATRDAFTNQMQIKLNGNVDLCKKFIPQWPVGCRRLTPGTNYLETLNNPNVEVVFSEITAVTESGCITATGSEYDLDVLICATGFDTSFKPRFPVIGLEKQNLQDEWSQEAQSYLGVAAAKMPNYLMFLSASSPAGNGPLLISIEAQADYMLALCDRWQTESIHSFVPKADVVKEFNTHIDSFMQRTVWKENCHSWYKSNSVSGRISALWPGSTLHYLEAMKEPRFDDWEIKYKGNRFAWLGNGLSQAETDPQTDLGWYIRDEDDGPFSSRRKWREVLTY